MFLLSTTQIESLQTLHSLELLRGGNKTVSAGTIINTGLSPCYQGVLSCPYINSFELINQLITAQLVRTSPSTVLATPPSTTPNLKCTILTSVGKELAKMVAQTSLTPENITSLLSCHTAAKENHAGPWTCGIGYFNGNILTSLSLTELFNVPITVEIIQQMLTAKLIWTESIDIISHLSTNNQRLQSRGLIVTPNVDTPFVLNMHIPVCLRLLFCIFPECYQSHMQLADEQLNKPNFLPRSPQFTASITLFL